MYCVTTGIQVVAKTKKRKSEALLPPKVIEILRGALLTTGDVTLSYAIIILKKMVTSEVWKVLISRQLKCKEKGERRTCTFSNNGTSYNFSSKGN